MSASTGVIARQSLWGTVATYIGVGIGFFTTFFVLTTYLTPEEVGLTRLLVEIATLISGICLVGLSTSISRYFPYFYEEPTASNPRPSHRGFLRWTLLVSGIGMAITLPLVLLGQGEITQLLGQGSELLGRFYLSLIPLTICLTLWTIAELYAVQTLNMIVPKVIRELLLRILLMLAYIVYALDWVDLTGFVYLFVGCYALCMLGAFAYLGRITTLTLSYDPTVVTPELRRGFGRYTALAILSTVGTTLAGRMDLFMLTVLDTEGLRSAAVFSIAFFMVSIVEIPTRVLISIATARIARAMKDGDLTSTSQLYERVARYQLLTGLIIYIGLLASVGTLIGLMPASKDYTGSAGVFVILGIAKLIEVTFTPLHPIVTTSRHYHWSLYYTLWLCLVAFVANAYLIPAWGIEGAAMATLTTTAVGYALLQALVYLRMGIHPLSWRLAGVALLGLVLAVALPILPEPSNPYLSIAVRSSLVLALAGAGTLILRLAPEAMPLVHKLLRR